MVKLKLQQLRWSKPTPDACVLAVPYDNSAVTENKISAGRDESNDLVMEKNPFVSRKHFDIIDRGDGHYTIRDHSKNGTFTEDPSGHIYFIHGKEVPIEPGTVIKLPFRDGNDVEQAHYYRFTKRE